MKVIIVEDDSMVAQLNAQYLSQLEGISVMGCFTNGRDALTYMESHTVDLAVMDMYMPNMNGLELLRSIRGAGIQCGVIMITAATEMQIVEDTIRLGIEDYIIKPFSYQRLRDAVQKYARKIALVKGSARADQSVVDQLLHSTFSPEQAPRELRKGLNAKTLQSLEQLLRENPESPHTCESISAVSGLSKVTVRHYLNFLMETGVLSSSIDYETGGRPRVLYRLK